MQKTSKCFWLLLCLVPIIIGVSQAIKIDFESPTEIYPGHWFELNITLHALDSETVFVYSYVYKGLDCIGQGWTANRQQIYLEPGENYLVLRDLVKLNTETGTYSVRVKVNASSGEFISTKPLYVLETQNTFKESYLYVVLVLISVAGIAFMFKLNK